MTKWILAGVAAVVAIVLVALLVGSRSAGQMTAMPNPNGYESLLAAGKLVKSAEDYGDWSRERLEEFLKEEAETLRLVREGLNQESRAVLPDSMEGMQKHLEDGAKLKRLAHLISAEGRLAELKGDFAGAAKNYLEVVKLGHEMSRGGVLIDMLIGMSIETIGLKKLESVKSELKAGEFKEALRELERIDERAQSFEETLQTERRWARNAGGLRVTLATVLKPGMLKAAEDKAEQKRQQVDVQRRSLMVNLAAQAHRVEKGKDATGYADVVPEFLKAIPRDPKTKGHLQFAW